jgi:ElaB/YqjD/DUF883 family membrane-anchored ribosome-binding protein
MSNIPAFPKDMPHLSMIPGESDSDLSTSHGGNESGLLSDVQTARRELGEKPGRLSDEIGELPAKAKRLAGNALGDYQSRVQKSLGGVENRIKDQPVKAILIAFGVGALLGLITRR